jgi:hypothetical protein
MLGSTAEVSRKPSAQSELPFSTGPTEEAESPIAGDLLIGAGKVAHFLFGSTRRRRAVYYLFETGSLPVFKLGGQLCARKSTLIEFIKSREGAALSTVLSGQAAE